MKALFRTRHRHTRGGFAAFVVLCLNFAVQPCAMALDEMDEHDCPHCPPAHTSQHGGHALATQSAAMQEMPCATSTDGCSLVDEFNYDGRTVQLKLKDAPVDLPLVIAPSFEAAPSRPPAAWLGWHPGRSPPPGNRISLNILYCVYLD